MADTTNTLALLAMFTSEEKAAEIEGDLLEQAVANGMSWYVLQLLGTLISLFLYGLRKEAGKLILLSYAVYELVLKLNWMVLRPLRRELGDRLGFAANEMLPVSNTFNGAVAVALAMLMIRLSPRYGAYVLVLAVGMMLGRVTILGDPLYALQLLCFAALPAFLGAFAMRRLLHTRHA
jgi:hypothetical protein